MARLLFLLLALLLCVPAVAQDPDHPDQVVVVSGNATVDVPADGQVDFLLRHPTRSLGDFHTSTELYGLSVDPDGRVRFAPAEPQVGGSWRVEITGSDATGELTLVLQMGVTPKGGEVRITGAEVRPWEPPAEPEHVLVMGESATLDVPADSEAVFRIEHLTRALSRFRTEAELYGLSVDPSGVVRFAPSVAQVGGSWDVVVVADSPEGETSLKLTLRVRPAGETLTVSGAQMRGMAAPPVLAPVPEPAPAAVTPVPRDPTFVLRGTDRVAIQVPLDKPVHFVLAHQSRRLGGFRATAELPGLSVAPDGRVRFVPSPDQVGGSWTVPIHAEDGRGPITIALIVSVGPAGSEQTVAGGFVEPLAPPPMQGPGVPTEVGLAVPAPAPAPTSGPEQLEVRDGTTVLEVPPDAVTDLLLVHAERPLEDFTQVGYVDGLVVYSTGRVRFEPSPEQRGQIIDVDIRARDIAAKQKVDLVLRLRVGAPQTATVEEPSSEPIGTAPPAQPGGYEGRARWPAYLYGIGTGMFIGGTTGYAIGHRSGDEASGTVIGAGLGAGLGAGTTALIVGLLPDKAPSKRQVMTMTTTTFMGGFTGIQVARAIIPVTAEDGPRRIALSGTLGAIGGAGVGLLWSPKAPSIKITANFDLAAAVGWAASAGALDIAGLEWEPDRRIRAPITLASAYVTGFAVALLRVAEVPGPNPGLLAVSLTQGAWIGAWAPYLASTRNDGLKVFGGMRLGLGAGYLLSQVLAGPIGPVDGRAAGLMTVGWAAGSALGAGIPLAAGAKPFQTNSDTRAVVGPMLGAGFAGSILGAAVAPHYNLSSNDIGLLSTLGVWTGYQAVGWAVYAGFAGADGSQGAGYALTAAGAGTLIAMGFAPLAEVTPPEALLAASMGGWATYYAAWIGHLARMNPDAHWALTLGAGDVALITSLAVLASPVESDWMDLVWIDGATFLGGALGSLIGIIASPEVDPVAIGGIVGATVGLGVGIGLAARGPAEAPANAVAMGIPLPHIDLPVRANISAAPWMDKSGKPGVWVQVNMVEIARDR